MKRVTIIAGVVSVLLFADGLWMVLTHYNVNNGYLFGDQNINLSEGQVMMISAGFLVLATVVMWVVSSLRSGKSAGRSAASDRPTSRV